MTRYIKITSLLTLSFLLASCFIYTPPETRHRAEFKKLFHFDKTYYVYEVKGKGDLPVQRVSLYPGFVAGCLTFPSMQDYSKNPMKWKEWHEGFTNCFVGRMVNDTIQYRILGTVDKNTTYRVDDVGGNEIALGYKTTNQTITITTGPLAGKQSILVWTINHTDMTLPSVLAAH